MNKIKNYIQNFMKYKSLLIQLVSRDIKIKYKRSILGIVWSLLNPILIMVVLTVVFSELFKFDVENYAAYLICGQVIFGVISESTNLAMSSIYTSGQLVKKVYIPKYIFPLSNILFSYVNLFFSMMALIIVFVFTGVPLKTTMALSVISLMYVFIFSVGLGLFLSSAAVFFRDIVHLYSVLLTAWMYMTPIFYPVDIVPQKYILFIYTNPLYYFIEHFRETVLYGNVPSMQLNLICFSYAATMFFIGLYIFYKKQDKFVLYI